MQGVKYAGLGNSFVIVFDDVVDADGARRLCDEAQADGVITANAGANGADLTMVLRNADGSEAEISGNGLACLGRAAVDAGRAAGPTVVVETAAGCRSVVVGPRVAVELGEAIVKDADEGAVFVDVGNPHLVYPRGDVVELGRRHLDMNVEVIERLDDATIGMVVHERGVGLTDACGSGAYASAAAARAWGWVGDVVTVRQPGGDATVDLAAQTYTVEVIPCR